MARERLSLPEFRFESGLVVRDVPVAFERWGQLNAAADNVILVCHALTGNTAADDWWGPLLGPGRAFDTDRYCVICANVLGSPYGTLSPVTPDPITGRPLGLDFPVPTVRDTVALHRQLLEALGVRQVAFAAGGSMGGMQALEWAFAGDFVRATVPIAVGGRHSAWCIAWSEAQRKAIVSDPAWQEGRYEPGAGPGQGLSIARMIAMISYRSHADFGGRFGREPAGVDTGLAFAMESYLRYQGDKLVERFDANCYLRLTQSMDTHDIARDRGDYDAVLAGIDKPMLVVGIDSDVLYPLTEQQELVRKVPSAELAVLEAPQGHDAFLIELGPLEAIIREWRERVID
jgi:homoserine O-acetyltransferase